MDIVKFDPTLSTMKFGPRMVARRPAKRSLRYSPDQPRDDHGRFGDGSGEVPTPEKLQAAIRDWQEGSSSLGSTQEKARTAAKNNDASDPLVGGIRSEEISTSIYRGLEVEEPEEITSWKPGADVQILPSSFSTSEDIAFEFANQSGDDGMTHVLLEVSSPTNGIDVNKNGRGDPGLWMEKEVISGGHYKVLSIKTSYYKNDEGTKLRQRRIILKQTGVF